MKTVEKIRTRFEQKGQQMLLLTLMLLVFTGPFVTQDPAMGWLSSIILMAAVLAATHSVSRSGKGFLVTLFLGIPALCSQIAEFATHNFWLETLRYSATALLFFWVCLLLLKVIALRSRVVTLELILASVNVYLMLGVGFALVFALIEHLQPGSFTGLDGFTAMPGQVPVFVYFSFVTMSTLGYGDISPVKPYAMTASYVLANLGQLYLAILVARLVSLYVGRGGNKDH